MHLELRLSHKGLLLVGLLLCLELSFIGALTYLQTQVEQQGEREEHSKQIVGRTNEIFELIYDAGTAADRFLKDPNDKDDKLYDEDIAQLLGHIKAIKPLLADKPQQLQVVNRVDMLCNSGFAMLRQFMDACKTKGREAAIAAELHRVHELKRMKHTILQSLRDMMQEENKIIQDSFAKRIQSVRFARSVLYGGLGLNVLGALMIALFFTRNITSRLEVLVENTRRLAAGKALNPTLPGTDEIAHLDRTFHQMADALHEAAERKKEIVAMVSHDLRTPLTSIQGFLNILSRGGYGPVSDTLVPRVKMAENSAARLIKLINDLLDLEKMEAGKMDLEQQPVSSTTIIAKSLDSLAEYAEQKGILVDAPMTVDFTVLADEDRTVQVLVNLLSNAVKFSDKGKTVKLDVVETDSFAEFRVVDEGPGIPQKAQEELFERFKQVKPTEDRKRGGTGLGLAISKAIIEQSGGTIGVTSEVGKGSCFWFRLPLAMPEKALSTTTAVPAK